MSFTKNMLSVVQTCFVQRVKIKVRVLLFRSILWKQKGTKWSDRIWQTLDKIVNLESDTRNQNEWQPGSGNQTDMLIRMKRDPETQRLLATLIHSSEFECLTHLLQSPHILHCSKPLCKPSMGTKAFTTYNQTLLKCYSKLSAQRKNGKENHGLRE